MGIRLERAEGRASTHKNKNQTKSNKYKSIHQSAVGDFCLARVALKRILIFDPSLTTLAEETIIMAVTAVFLNIIL
jgi:hypothetical protein